MYAFEEKVLWQSVYYVTCIKCRDANINIFTLPIIYIILAIKSSKWFPFSPTTNYICEYTLYVIFDRYLHVGIYNIFPIRLLNKYFAYYVCIDIVFLGLDWGWG